MSMVKDSEKGVDCLSLYIMIIIKEQWETIFKLQKPVL